MEAPKCKLCGERHWGTCADHGAKGYLSGHVAQQSTAARKDVPRSPIAEKPVEKRMLAGGGETPTGGDTNAKALEAGTQAPPVDTEINPTLSEGDIAGIVAAAKRGRPPKPDALTPAERARRHREKAKGKP